MNPSNTMNEKITIQELANILAEKHGVNKKDAELFIKGMFDLIEEALTTEKYVKIKGLGIFKLTEVDSRESINVNTGERIEIQGHTKISFTPDASLKELINKPFSHFETVVLNDGVQLEDTKVEAESGEKSVPSLEETVTATVEEETSEIQENEVAKEEAGATVEEKEEIPVTTEPETVEEETVDPIKEPEEETETIEPLVETIETAEEIVDEKDESEATETVAEESVEEEVKEEKPVIIPTKESETPKEKTNKSLVFITILLILIILGGTYWLFFPSEESNELPIKEKPVEMQAPTIDSVTTVLPQKDTLSQEMVVEKEEKVIPEEQVDSLADTTDYVIVGTKATHTLQNGETIIRVALKYYGSKNFWPYIAKHNEKTIKNENNVPVGTKLLIPELTPRK